MSEVEFAPFAAHAGEGNPAIASTPKQTGATAWFARVVRPVGNLDTGENIELAERFAERTREGRAGATSYGLPNSNRGEEAVIRGRPIDDRQVRVILAECANQPPAAGSPTRPARQDPASNAGESLAPVSASHHPLPTIDQHKLTPEALARLRTDLESGTSAGQIPAPARQDENESAHFPFRLTHRFLRERAAARAAVGELNLGAAAKAAIADEVIHDDIPAALIPVLGNAYVRVKDDLARLGTPLAGRALQNTVRAIRDAMTNAFDEAGIELNIESRHRACKMFWRFVLAPGADVQAQAIANQLNPAGSPLRALGEAVTWYRDEHHRAQPVPLSSRRGREPSLTGQPPRTGQHSRTGQQPFRMAQQSCAMTNAGSAGTSAVSQESLRAATDYSVMMRSLAEVLDEKTGCFFDSLTLFGNDDVPDHTIATLRNLGVSMPAPARLGKKNRGTPVSEPGFAAMRQQLEEHIRIKSNEKTISGALAECIYDLHNNTFSIENRKLPHNNRVIRREIAEFCADQSGTANRQLLKNLSMLAYHGGFNCVRDTCLNTARPEIALFSEEPVITEVEQSHNLSRNESGDVILHSDQIGKVQQIKRRDEHGKLEIVDLDPNESRLGLTVRYKLNGETGKPTLEDVGIDYAFVLPAEVTEGRASADESIPGLEGSADLEDAEDAELRARLQRLREL